MTQLDFIESFGSSIVKKFSMLFMGLGEMVDSEYEIKLKPDVQPFGTPYPEENPDTTIFEG